jgi:hypothetical protein
MSPAKLAKRLLNLPLPMLSTIADLVTHTARAQTKPADSTPAGFSFAFAEPFSQSQPAGCFVCRLNKLGRNELSTMPKIKPTSGPMRMQPIRSAVIPMISSVGKVKRAPQPKQKPTTTEAVRAEKSKATRLTSLQKQREALKATSGN